MCVLCCLLCLSFDRALLSLSFLFFVRVRLTLTLITDVFDFCQWRFSGSPWYFSLKYPSQGLTLTLICRSGSLLTFLRGFLQVLISMLGSPLCLFVIWFYETNLVSSRCCRYYLCLCSWSFCFSFALLITLIKSNARLTFILLFSSTATSIMTKAWSWQRRFKN